MKKLFALMALLSSASFGDQSADGEEVLVGDDPLSAEESPGAGFLSVTPDQLLSRFALPNEEALLAFFRLGPWGGFDEDFDQFSLAPGGVARLSFSPSEARWFFRDRALVIQTESPPFSSASAFFLSNPQLFPNIDVERCPSEVVATEVYEFFLGFTRFDEGVVEVDYDTGIRFRSEACAIDPSLSLSGFPLKLNGRVKQSVDGSSHQFLAFGSPEAGPLLRLGLVDHKKTQALEPPPTEKPRLFYQGSSARFGGIYDQAARLLTLDPDGTFSDELGAGAGTWNLGAGALRFFLEEGDTEELKQLAPVSQAMGQLALVRTSSGDEEAFRVSSFSFAGPPLSAEEIEASLPHQLLIRQRGGEGDTSAVSELPLGFQEFEQFFPDGSYLGGFYTRTGDSSGRIVRLFSGTWKAYDGELLGVGCAQARDASAKPRPAIDSVELVARSDNNAGVAPVPACFNWAPRRLLVLREEGGALRVVDSGSRAFQIADSVEAAHQLFKERPLSETFSFDRARLSTYRPSLNISILDPDGDGVDYLENDAFPFDSSESVDTDGDGLGNNQDQDDDGDGLKDTTELALGLDPLRVDSDQDGTSDREDEYPLDPTETADTDGDGLGNNRESSLGLDSTRADTDGDGIDDGEELEAGTDPLSDMDPPLGGLSPALLKVLSDLHRGESLP